MVTVKEARNSGKGINLSFKEKANFEEICYNFCCTCYRDIHKRAFNKFIVVDRYEIPKDIHYMNNDVGTSWTEDIKCPNCGKMYSRTNRCYIVMDKYVHNLYKYIVIPLVKLVSVAPFIIGVMLIACVFYLSNHDYTSAVACGITGVFTVMYMIATNHYAKKSPVLKEYLLRK